MKSIEVIEYHKRSKRRILSLFILVVVICVISIYSLSVSSFNITFEDACTVIYNYINGIEPVGYINWIINDIVVNDNAPRTLCGIMVGIILAIGGAVMQSITRNPLADPYTIGISSSAMLGVTLFIIFGLCIIPGLDDDLAIIANAFIFAMIPAVTILFVSSHKKMSPTMMILVGIGMMYMFSAFTTFIKFNAEAEDLETIYEWSLGTLTGVGWDAFAPLLTGAVLILVTMLFFARKIDVLASGDNMSTSLGVNPTKLRVMCLVIISICTAMAVCYTGTIGFVGLVAPHIARLFVGSNNRILIMTSGVIGALMVVGSDVIVRCLPGGLPLGVITALIGSPLFLYFLYKQRKNAAF